MLKKSVSVKVNSNARGKKKRDQNACFGRWVNSDWVNRNTLLTLYMFRINNRGAQNCRVSDPHPSPTDSPTARSATTIVRRNVGRNPTDNQ